MASGAPPAPVPLFIEADGRRLFALHHAPAGTPRGAVVFLPPFAEELNMSRRMAYLLGRALADAGYAFLEADLTGTGESAGDFADARWETWRGDARAAVAWLAASSGCEPALLALRAGALLAADIASSDARPRRLILWQPVGNGQTMMSQFLRIRVAAGLMGGDKETTAALRAEWTAGRAVEVAGYEVHPELAHAVDALSLAALAPPAGSRVDWIETGDAERGAAPASQRTIEAWREAGLPVALRICPGEPFWTIQETTLAPAMIAATLAALSDESHSGGSAP